MVTWRRVSTGQRALDSYLLGTCVCLISVPVIATVTTCGDVTGTSQAVFRAQAWEAGCIHIIRFEEPSTRVTNTPKIDPTKLLIVPVTRVKW